MVPDGMGSPRGGPGPERVKAAAVLERLGLEQASELVKHLSGGDLEVLAASFVEMSGMPLSERGAVAEEALGELLEGLHGEADPLGFARKLLSEHLGEDAARRALGDAAGVRGPDGSLEWVPDSAAERLAQAVSEENPRIVAMILGSVRSSLAARLLPLLPPELAGKSLLRLAEGGEPMPEAAARVLARVAQIVSGAEGMGVRAAGGMRGLSIGPERVVEILRLSDRPTERAALEYLEQQRPELAQQVSQSIFSTIEDLKWLEKQSLQLVLREVERRDLACALRGASGEMLQLCRENLSENAAASLEEEMESLGPTPRREVDEAQQRILALVRAMIEEERIQVAHEEEDELI